MRLGLLLFAAVGVRELSAQAQDAPIPGLGARVTAVRFFEGPRPPPTLRDRVYATAFDAASARSIYTSVGLAYPPTREPTSLRIDCGYTAPDGALAGTAAVQVQVDAGWELSVHAGGVGAETPGGWKAGKYDVSCRYAGKVIAIGSFEITAPAVVVSPAAPKSPDKPASKPAKRGKEPAKPLTPFGTLKAKVLSIKLFESGGGIPDPKNRVVTSTFNALTTRFINLELELEYPKAAKPVEFAVPCQIEGPDSAVRTPTVKGTVQAGWVGSFHATGWGSRDRGMWPEGDYRITCRDAGQPVATTEFKVVKAPAAVAALGASLTHIRFFQSLGERLPLESRLYGARFDSRTARWIKTEFGLVYPAVAAPVSFRVECAYAFPDGTVRPVLVERRVPASQNGSVHAQGVGFDRPGSWPPGAYRVSCRNDGKEFAAGTFEIVDGGIPAAPTPQSGLLFFVRKAGDPPAPTYAVTFESGAFDTLYVEATMPARSAGDSTVFRCGLTDPAGITSAFSVPGEVKEKALVGTGRINAFESPKTRGTYRVECRVGAKGLAADRFDLAGKPDLPGIDAKLLASAVYEGGEVAPDDEAVPDVTWSAATVRSLWLVGLLDHPTGKGAGRFTYACRILTGKNVKLVDTGPVSLTLSADDRSIVMRQRLALAPKRRWTAGRLTLTCMSDGVVFLKQALDLLR